MLLALRSLWERVEVIAKAVVEQASGAGDNESGYLQSLKLGELRRRRAIERDDEEILEVITAVTMYL
jgi:hypothetical protein